MWGFGHECDDQDPAEAGHFDKHEQALDDTYRTSMLPLPPMTEWTGGDRRTIEDTWGAGMQVLAQVVTKRGDTMQQQTIGVALQFGESEFARVWDSGRSVDSSLNALAVMATEAFASGFREGAPRPRQLVASSEEHPIPALQTVDVVPWACDLFRDTSASLQRVNHEHASMTMDLEDRPSPLTRDPGLERPDICTPGVSEVLSETSAADSLPSLECLELLAMEDAVPCHRFIESLSKQSGGFYERAIATSELLGCALSIDRSDNIIDWLSALKPTNPSEWDSCAEEYPVIQQCDQPEDTIQSSHDQQLELKKIKHNGDALHMPATFLRSESASVLKKIVRKNAASALLQESDKIDFFKIAQVVQVATRSWNPWQFSFADISRSSLVDSSVDPQLQQLMMPSRLAHEDDKKPEDAVVRVIDSGRQFLQRIYSSASSLPPRPLTSILLSIPSLWSLKCVTDVENGRFGEAFAWMQVPDSVKNDNQIGADKLKENEIVTHSIEAAPDIKAISHETTNAEGQSLVTEIQQPRTMLLMLDGGPATTEDLVSDFLGATSKQLVIATQRAEPSSVSCGTDNAVRRDQQNRVPIEHLARPVLWDLARKKVIRVNPNSVQCALEALSLELLESIVLQQQATLKKISKNPSAFSHEAIFDACTSFRQSTWLHTLRMISLCGEERFQVGNAQFVFVKKFITASSYRSALGPSHIQDLGKMSIHLGGVPIRSEDEADADSSELNKRAESEYAVTKEPPTKKRKILSDEEDRHPIRVICSARFLSQDGLLDELSTEHAVSVVERDLQCPIDLVVDERNGICVFSTVLFEDTNSMKSLTYKLAISQIQFQNLWIIIVEDASSSPAVEGNLQAFFAALVHFRVEVRTFTSTSDEETGRCIRAIIDQCAQTALDDHRTLPRMWYERPFLLEDESQLERFLASTQIITPYAAQSLLHKMSIEDLFSSSLEHLQRLVQDSVSKEQLQLLWGMMQQSHGILQQEHDQFGKQ